MDEVYAQNRQEWREWLERNYQGSDGIWLIYYKAKSGKSSVSYDEAVEEALCFGWIDSKVNPIDQQRYKQVFTPRKPRSVWSKLNKHRVEQLIQAGLMTNAGLQKIEAAQKDGSWTVLDASEALEIPTDLEIALAANETAQKNFIAFSNSSKKNILTWIGSAKREETRAKRIQETVTLAAQNIRAKG